MNKHDFALEINWRTLNPTTQDVLDGVPSLRFQNPPAWSCCCWCLQPQPYAPSGPLQHNQVDSLTDKSLISRYLSIAHKTPYVRSTTWNQLC